MIRFKRGWVTEGENETLMFHTRKPSSYLCRHSGLTLWEYHCDDVRLNVVMESPFPADMPYSERIMEVGE